MKKLILWAAVILLLSSLSFAQGTRVGSDATPIWTTSTIGNVAALTPVPNAKINFCSHPANAVPCTNYVTTYTDSTLGTPCSNSTQIVLSGTSTCVANADVNGNWGVYVSPAILFDYTITTGTSSSGPFIVTGGTLLNTLLSSSNVWTGSNTFNLGLTATTTNGLLNEEKYSGSDAFARANTAVASSDCPSTGCEIHFPVPSGGVYNVATTLLPATSGKTIRFVCDGTSAMANVTTHSAVTFNWTGGASPMVTFTGAANANGHRMENCGFNNSGTATKAILIDSAAGEGQLKDITIYTPTVPFSDSCIDVGPSGQIVDETFTNVTAFACAPVGVRLNNIQYQFVGNHLRVSHNSTTDLILGVSSPVDSFNCFGCVFEHISGVSNVINYVDGAHFIGGGQEGGGGATSYLDDVPSSATRIRDLTFDDVYFSCAIATCPNAPVHTNFASAQVAMYGDHLNGFASGAGIIWNDASASVLLSGNQNQTSGGVIVGGTQGSQNVVQFGNTVAGALQSGSFGGNTNIWTNAADAQQNFYLDSGASVTQNTFFGVRDRGTLEWFWGKSNTNFFKIADNIDSVNVFTAIQSGATEVLSQSTAAIRLNVTNGSGTGGEQFGDGAGNVKASVNSSGGGTFSSVISGGSAAVLTGTGACATITTQHGGSFAGDAKCTAGTAASTLTIAPGSTAPNGWVCYVQDETTRANLFQQTSHNQTTCTLTATSITQNDVFVFSAIAY